MSDLDMPLEPETVHLLRTFRDGNDANASDAHVQQLASKASDYVYGLSNRKKGEVIIDLLTICDIMQQTVSIMKTQHMEEMEKLRGND